jgi:hypothetical protein
MKNPLRTPEDYELFLYTLTKQFRLAGELTKIGELIESQNRVLDQIRTTIAEVRDNSNRSSEDLAGGQ